MDNNKNSILTLLLDEIDFQNSIGIDEPKVRHFHESEYILDFYHKSICNFNIFIICSFRS